jgi:cytochrome b
MTTDYFNRNELTVDTPQRVKQRQVWDLPVRLFHWALVAAFISAFVTNRLGVAYFQYHVWSGYAVITLVSFRILWGLIGTRHAKFWQFVRGPGATLRYAHGVLHGRTLRYAGHNPLGAYMVVTLLIAIGTQAVSGLFGNDDIFNTGPLVGYVDKELSLRLTSLHRHLFYWIAAAVAVHVVAVIAHQVFKQENLIVAMITGRKPQHCVPEGEIIHSSRTWLAVLLVVALAAVLWLIVAYAPLPIDDDASF